MNKLHRVGGGGGVVGLESHKANDEMVKVRYLASWLSSHRAAVSDPNFADVFGRR